MRSAPVDGGCYKVISQRWLACTRGREVERPRMVFRIDRIHSQPAFLGSSMAIYRTRCRCINGVHAGDYRVLSQCVDEAWVVHQVTSGRGSLPGSDPPMLCPCTCFSPPRSDADRTGTEIETLRRSFKDVDVDETQSAPSGHHPMSVIRTTPPIRVRLRNHTDAESLKTDRGWL